MTDNEIIKALECCASEQYTCSQCPYQEIKHYDDDNGFEIMPNGKRYDDWSCERWLNVDLLDLINRQKAEIDELQLKNDELKQDRYLVKENGAIELLPRTDIEKIKAEAIKEFAERLKATFPNNSHWVKPSEKVDNLVKEMVGDYDESTKNS